MKAPATRWARLRVCLSDLAEGVADGFGAFVQVVGETLDTILSAVLEKDAAKLDACRHVTRVLSMRRLVVLAVVACYVRAVWLNPGSVVDPTWQFVTVTMAMLVAWPVAEKLSAMKPGKAIDKARELLEAVR